MATLNYLKVISSEVIFVKLFRHFCPSAANVQIVISPDVYDLSKTEKFASSFDIRQLALGTKLSRMISATIWLSTLYNP
jgi:hypothetical protein